MPNEREDMNGTTLSLEELESRSSATEAAPEPKASDVKITAADVPDYLRGKSVGEIVEMVERTQKALRMSEDARLALRNTIEGGGQPQAPAPEQPKQLTRDEIKELMENDPLAAFEYMQNNLVRSLDDHLNVRLQPVVQGTLGTYERSAREKYSTEFELFGDQIEAAKKMVDPRVLATEQGWKDIISFVRGQDDNLDKLIQHRSGRNPSNARAEQISNSGFSSARTGAVTRTSEPTGGDFGLDETQKEIARELYPELTPEKAYIEYKRWS